MWAMSCGLSAAWSSAGPLRCQASAPAPIAQLFARLAQERVLLTRLLDRAGNSRTPGHFLDLLEQTLLDTPWSTCAPAHRRALPGGRAVVPDRLVAGAGRPLQRR